MKNTVKIGIFIAGVALLASCNFFNKPAADTTNAADTSADVTVSGTDIDTTSLSATSTTVAGIE